MESFDLFPKQTKTEPPIKLSSVGTLALVDTIIYFPFVCIFCLLNGKT